MMPHLVLLDVDHLGYDGGMKRGQLVVHEAMRERFASAFASLVELKYPIEQIRPMVAFGWSDALAMADNNTSIYRPDFIGNDPKTRSASEHTRGSAVDINPLDNWLRNPDGSIEPVESMYRIPRGDVRISGNLAVIEVFDALGMEYGGYWPVSVHATDYYGPIVADNHHFELRPNLVSELYVPEGIWRK